MPDLMLQTFQLSKSYSGVTVLDRADLSIKAGHVHALLGANGAGKSTLSRIIAGLIPASNGTMQFLGLPHQPRNKREAERAGIEIVQQEFNLLPTLTVAENLFLRDLPRRFGVLQKRKLAQSAHELLCSFGLTDLDPNTPLSRLGVGQQQMVEIAAAFARQCKLLILDEPTAALSQRETDLLFAQIKRLQADGNSILYISHRLDEIQQICDRVTILRDGQIVKNADVVQIDKAEIIRWMSGNEGTASINSKSRSVTPTASDNTVGLRVERLCCGPVREVSFEAVRGKPFGITGLVGSGRSRLLRAIFGAVPLDSGAIYIGNQSTPCKLRSPADAVAQGFALVTEDRKQNGLLLPMSIQHNSTLASLKSRFSCWGLIRRSQERSAALSLCDQLQTKCNSVSQPVGTLSGGNQQKVVLAKWLIRDSEVFLFDEPTRGVDVAARKLVHHLIEQLARSGKTVVVVSSDMDELFETCEQIAVMSQGRIVQQFERIHFSREAITKASFAEPTDLLDQAAITN